MKKPVALFSFPPVCSPLGNPPVPYSRRVAINGVNYHGQAKFAFAIQDANGTVHWRNGVNRKRHDQRGVVNGPYVVHLGGQGYESLACVLVRQP